MSLKHFLRDLIIIILTISGTVLAYRMTRRAKGPLVRVIVFHDVENVEWFRKTISMVVKHFNVVTPQQFHDNDVDSSKVNVLITFDDGYQSWIDNCLPVLDEYDIKAIFFVNSGLLECAKNISASAEFMERNLLVSPKQPLTWDGVQNLLGRGHTIGGHTKNHVNLTGLSEGLATKEVVDDKNIFESNLKVALEDFAYPFGTIGYYNRYVAQIVYERGYRFGYTAISGFVDMPAKETFFIPRVCLEKNQSTFSVKLWIKGGYDLFNKLKF